MDNTVTQTLEANPTVTVPIEQYEKLVRESAMLRTLLKLDLPNYQLEACIVAIRKMLGIAMKENEESDE